MHGNGPILDAVEGESFSSRYQLGLALVFVLLFYTGATVWSFDSGALSIPPNRWLLGIAALTLPLLVPARLGSILRAPLAIWMGLYIVLTAAWFVFSGATDASIQQVGYRLFALTFLFVALLLFSDPRTHRPVRLAIALCVVLGASLNLYDLLHPLAFSRDIGRAAGLYENANVSGMALTLGMVISIGALKAALREPFFVTAFAGVLFTQSRSALLAFLIAAVALSFGRQIRVSRAAGLAVLAVVVTILMLWVTGQLGPLADLVTSGELLRATRLTSATGAETEGDFYSTQSRIQVAQYAWDTFSQHPLFGGGLGASGYTVHNMYLMLAADQGIFGLLLYPLFLAAVAWPAPLEERRMLVSLALGLAVWGFFSHNVLDEMHVLLCAALATSLAMTYRRTQPTTQPAPDRA